MKTRLHQTAALWLACAALALPAAAQQGDPIITDALQANLQPVDGRLAVVFAAPELDLSGYKAVMLEPVTVNYERGEGRMYRLGKTQLEALQQHARAALERQLSANGGYEVVDEPGPGTLSIRASLQNVLLAFPEGAAPGTKTFADYAVKMSLEAELVDSRSGEVLMIVADRQGDKLSPKPREVTNVDAWAEADKAFNYWAGVLRQRLDGARKTKP